MSTTSLQLSELNIQIRNATESSFPQALWVRAEILEMQINRSGHCYLELIEKSELDNTIIAKNRGTIWSFKFRMLRPYFESVTGIKLEAGIKVLIKVEVSYHEIYSLSLNITDIDPSYTMGDLALRKREIIKKLELTGLMHMNQELKLPEAPQSVAVISSETAAGYGDFIDSLINNSSGFSFNVSFYPAIVQGEGAEKSIIKALDRVFELEVKYDVVVIIRGGGSQADLECFNNYDLAINIAQFPIPVITGIGHERDETIADLVANQSLKTPTAVAEFLIDKLEQFDEKILRLQERFDQTIKWIIQQQSMTLQQKASDVHLLVRQFLKEENFLLREYKGRTRKGILMFGNDSRNLLNAQKRRLKYLWRIIAEHSKRDIENAGGRLSRNIKSVIQTNKGLLSGLEKSLDLISPEKVLSRGYSITYANGKLVKSIKSLNKNANIQTRLLDGTIDSEIIAINNKNK